jgi:hypothetical protein
VAQKLGIGTAEVKRLKRENAELRRANRLSAADNPARTKTDSQDRRF